MMSITKIEESNNKYKEGYKQGVFDLLKQIYLSKGVDLSDQEINEYVDYFINDGLEIEKILTHITEINHTFNSETFESYPDAMNNIAKYISEYSSRKFSNSREGQITLYEQFGNAFNFFSFILNRSIEDYLNAGGYEIGVMISLTYVSLNFLYKISFLKLMPTISGTARLFGKNATATKRLIYRFRDEKQFVMDFLESEEKQDLTFDEGKRKIKSLLNI